MKTIKTSGVEVLLVSGPQLEALKTLQPLAAFVRGCVALARGDDYERAKLAFDRMTPEQMQEQYGQSGKTRQQVLDRYRQYTEQCDAAIKAFEEIAKL